MLMPRVLLCGLALIALIAQGCNDTDPSDSLSDEPVVDDGEVLGFLDAAAPQPVEPTEQPVVFELDATDIDNAGAPIMRVSLALYDKPLDEVSVTRKFPKVLYDALPAEAGGVEYAFGEAERVAGPSEGEFYAVIIGYTDTLRVVPKPGLDYWWQSDGMIDLSVEGLDLGEVELVPLPE